MIYTLTLNPALDYHIYVDNFNKNSLNLAKDTAIFTGGKGINVAKILNTFSLKATTLGFIGGFSGKKITTDLDRLSIKHCFMSLIENTRINIKLHDVHDKSETEIAGISPNIPPQLEQELLSILKNTLQDKDILVCSGSIPKGISHNIYKKIAQDVENKHDIKVILDTRGESLRNNIYKNFLIKPNIHELEAMLQQKLYNNLEIVKACQYFFNHNIQNIIVSMGSLGSLFINENLAFHTPPLEIATIDMVNSIGAGDAMVAGFIAGVCKGLSPLDCYKLATATACATIVSRKYATEGQINKFYDKIIINKL